MAKVRPRKLGRPPSSMSTETRERIIDAGRQLFATHGYDKTTNKEIAEAAGLTTGALYHYFDSKQALFASVLVAQQERVLDQIRGAANDVHGAIAKLRAVLAQTVQLNSDDPELARFVAIAPIEIDRHEEFQTALTDAAGLTRTGGLNQFLLEIVADGQAAGELDSGVDPTAVVNMLLAAMSGLAQLAGFARKPRALADAVDAFIRLLAGTLVTTTGPGLTGARHASRRRWPNKVVAPN